VNTAEVQTCIGGPPPAASTNEIDNAHENEEKNRRREPNVESRSAVNLFRRRKKTAPSEQRDDAKRAALPDDLGRVARDVKSNEGSSMSQPNAPTNERAASETDAAAEQPVSDGAAHPAPGSRAPAELRGDVVAVLKTIYDPEIPVDIYELGLIYEVEVEPTGDVEIVMTLTTPMCPVAETLPPEVEAKVRDVPGVGHVQLELVWEPPWSMDMMSEAARLELNL
jgi:FeS assembly SUF system protein